MRTGKCVRRYFCFTILVMRYPLLDSGGVRKGFWPNDAIDPNIVRYVMSWRIRGWRGGEVPRRTRWREQAMNCQLAPWHRLRRRSHIPQTDVANYLARRFDIIDLPISRDEKLPVRFGRFNAFPEAPSLFWYRRESEPGEN